MGTQTFLELGTTNELRVENWKRHKGKRHFLPLQQLTAGLLLAFNQSTLEWLEVQLYFVPSCCTAIKLFSVPKAGG